MKMLRPLTVLNVKAFHDPRVCIRIIPIDYSSPQREVFQVFPGLLITIRYQHLLSIPFEQMSSHLIRNLCPSSFKMFSVLGAPTLAAI